MSSRPGRVMALPDLVTGLREHAGGVYAYRAAVELLVEHGIFLGRRAFRDEFVRVTRDGGVYVRWAAAVAALNREGMACSSSEAGILRIAASLGGDVPLRLGRVLGGFDTANVTRIADAVSRANHGRAHQCHRPGDEERASDGR